MSEKETEVPLEQTLVLLQKNARAQSLYVWLTIPLALLMLMATMISCAFLLQKVKPLVKLTPEYRLKLAYVDIKLTRSDLEERFKPYHILMENDVSQKLFIKFKNEEEFPVEAEGDLIALIEDYRSALFNLASNIAGSGEWHRYHREELRDFLERAKLRQDTLKKMIVSKPDTKTPAAENHKN